MSVGSRIKMLREEMGLSQRQLAEELEISRPSITKYERDEREPNYMVFLKIADFFGVSTDFLLGKTNEKDKNIHDYIRSAKKLEDVTANDFISDDLELNSIQKSAINGLLACYISKIVPDNPWTLDWIYLSTILFDAIETHCYNIFDTVYETKDNYDIDRKNIDSKLLSEIQKEQKILISAFNDTLDKVKEMALADMEDKSIYFLDEITETFNIKKGKEYIANREKIYEIYKNMKNIKICK